MTEYAIGDVQGCYDALLRLLDTIHFNDRSDRLWFVGDLVNRGPQSLEVLRFIKQLPVPAQISLGNHDLYLLSLGLTDRAPTLNDDTLLPVLKASDRDELCEWLCQQRLLCFDAALSVVICHAGVAPMWSLSEAQAYALEVEQVLRSSSRVLLLEQMYGNSPNRWSPDLEGMTRLRVICNYFTRMRFCFRDGSLDFEHQGSVVSAPQGLYPWYALPTRVDLGVDLVFGHWAALDGEAACSSVYAIDTGYVWGGRLTALDLKEKSLASVGWKV